MSSIFKQREKEIELDEIKLRRMRLAIYNLEREFYRTKKYTHEEMKRKIREIIVREYRKKI